MKCLCLQFGVFIFAVLSLQSGCAQSKHEFVTRAELSSLLIHDSLKRDAYTQEELAGVLNEDSETLIKNSLKMAVANLENSREEIERLRNAAFTSEDISTRTTAMLASDQLSYNALMDTLHAISIATESIIVNITNANTVAYSLTRPVFSDDGTHVYLQRNFSPGPALATNRTLDLLIEGEGFFILEGEDAQIKEHYYTRNGQFTLNADGEIVHAQPPYRLLSPVMTIPIGVPRREISVSADGTISVYDPVKRKLEIIGQLYIARFSNNEGLEYIRGNYFVETEESGEPFESYAGEDGAGFILSGFIEGSNVSQVLEFIHLSNLRKWYNGIAQAMNLIAGEKLAAQVD